MGGVGWNRVLRYSPLLRIHECLKRVHNIEKKKPNGQLEWNIILRYNPLLLIHECLKRVRTQK